MDENERKNLFETANGRSVGSLAFYRDRYDLWTSGIQVELVFN